MVQVYRDIGGGWPMLTRANYHEWSLLMKVKLQARGLWEAVAYGDVIYEDDRWALEALCAAVPADLGATLANKPTAKLAWEAIASVAPRCSGSAASGKASPFSPVSKLRTLLFA